VIDASKRSTRLNAFFSGFGRFKSIILYDTLIDKCSTDEILSVLAHEIGHAKHKDVLKNIVISITQIGFNLALLGFFLSYDGITTTFGFEGSHIGFSIILFGILMSPIGLLLQFPFMKLSRTAEYKADAYAAEVGYKEAMIGALKVLARENFANLTPHPLVVKMRYTHPTIQQRVEALMKRS
jgi:STE24 endopeptidase